ncbi:MAG: hypothetical protein SF187_30420 [Deltaproteobacteria bacterium]|nr:hypothetical protein [Deltaproteobacteria bacterium]
MSPTSEMIRIALLCLVAGVSLPLLVQLFLTLRSLQKVIVMFDKRLDPALRDLSHAIEGLRKAEPSNAASVIGAAALPALLAAFNAWKTHMAERASAESTTPTKDPTP